jgi:hypothetical protein
MFVLQTKGGGRTFHSLIRSIITAQINTVLVKEPKNIDGILSEYAYLVGLTFFCFRNTFQNSNNSVFLSTTGKSLTMTLYIGDCYLHAS